MDLSRYLARPGRPVRRRQRLASQTAPRLTGPVPVHGPNERKRADAGCARDSHNRGERHVPQDGRDGLRDMEGVDGILRDAVENVHQKTLLHRRGQQGQEAAAHDRAAQTNTQRQARKLKHPLTTNFE